MFYSTYSSNSSRCSMGIVSSNTLKNRKARLAKLCIEQTHSVNKATKNKYTLGCFTDVSHREASTADPDWAGISPSFTFRIWTCQTHSLSMEKQVTGPSAVQVAVLKTSLQEEKHCSCPPGENYISLLDINPSVTEKSEILRQLCLRTWNLWRHRSE